MKDHPNPADRDQGSDRPGRAFSSGGNPHGGQGQLTGSQNRSGYEETDFHQLEEDRFAGEVAEALIEKSGGQVAAQLARAASAPAVATRQNGDAASHCRAVSSRLGRSFVATRCSGWPRISRSSSWLVTSDMHPTLEPPRIVMP